MKKMDKITYIIGKIKNLLIKLYEQGKNGISQHHNLHSNLHFAPPSLESQLLWSRKDHNVIESGVIIYWLFVRWLSRYVLQY